MCKITKKDGNAQLFSIVFAIFTTKKGCISTLQPKKVVFRIYNQKRLYFDFTTKKGCISTLQPKKVVFRTYNQKRLYLGFTTKKGCMFRNLSETF